MTSTLIILLFLCLIILVGLGLSIRLVMQGWERTETTCEISKCERCWEERPTLTWVLRRPRWVSVLGYVLIAAPVVLLGPSFIEDLQIARSGALDAEWAGFNSAVMGVFAVPFVLLGGFLAFPFKKGIWRCESCGHILDQASLQRPVERSLTSENRRIPLASWLFIKGGQSIWVERLNWNTMLVAGPAAAREERNFPGEDALQAFQRGLGERLTNGGWFLWGHDRERRDTAERRRVARTTGDRRLAA